MRQVTTFTCSFIKEATLILGCVAIAALAEKHLSQMGYLIFNAATTYGTICLVSLIGYAADTKENP